MKSIYILLTRSTTSVSRAISFATLDKYTHVSISFDKELQNMYSFARKNPAYPLPAGLIHETPATGYYQLNPNIPCALYEIKVTQKEYNKARLAVDFMYQQEDRYQFNILGLVLCRLGISYTRHTHYFCSQFVGEVLEISGVLQLPKPAHFMRPSDYMNLSELDCIFEGRLFELQLVLAQETRTLPHFSQPSLINT